jgi:hypothetical protein
MWENIVTIHNILKKKITKQNRQKTILGQKKEEKIHKKSHVGKHCSNP